ncbi:hypothetical protein DMH01_17925 [Amycolatopsis sp. WAC 04182]|nr:hypothetical protein DMH01_17925 [Amycolatopsis sp. WAC 04182]
MSWVPVGFRGGAGPPRPTLRKPLSQPSTLRRWLSQRPARLGALSRDPREPRNVRARTTCRPAS